MKRLRKMIRKWENKFSDETNARAKAEAEVVRAHKMIDYLQEMVENRRGGEQRSVRQEDRTLSDTTKDRSYSKPRCLDQDRLGGCKFGNICKFAHDVGREEVKIAKVEDCGFWLEGFCRFSDQACRHVHDPAKRGSVPPRQDGRRASAVSNVSFLGHSQAGVQVPAANQGHHHGLHAGAGLQLVPAGDQFYLHQRTQHNQLQMQPGQLVQQPPQLMLVQGAHGLQGVQPGLQGAQLGSQGSQVILQGRGLGGWTGGQ